MNQGTGNKAIAAVVAIALALALIVWQVKRSAAPPLPPGITPEAAANTSAASNAAPSPVPVEAGAGETPRSGVRLPGKKGMR